MTDLITSQVVIFDNGSGSVKCGFAGKDKPDVNVPCLIGNHKFVKTAFRDGNDGELVGDEARKHRGLLQLRYPMAHGKISRWPDMEKVWHASYAALGVSNPEEHPMHLTEPPLNPRSNRERMATVFFEQFGTPALFSSIQAILSLYSAGKTSGLALDCGDGVCHAVPSMEGYLLPYGVERSDIGGRDVTHLLQRLLRKSGYIFNTSAEFDIVREIKETVCSVNTKAQRNLWDAVREMNQGSTLHVSPSYYTLPDNTQIEVGSERIWAPETLFHPILSGKEDLGVHELVQVAISRSPLDARATLWDSIVLSGGSTLFPSFPERLLGECRRLCVKDTKIRISAPPNRINSVFVGASIFASLSQFKKMWVTKKEYDEIGPHVLARKFGD